MSILNIFKGKKDQGTKSESVASEQSAKDTSANETVKPKHGDDGVCCGGCQ